MDVINLVLYSMLFTTGFFSADYVVKKFSPQFFIEIKTRSKVYRAKIHHLYLSIFGLLTYFFDVYLLTFFLIGVGIHDAVLEIKNKIIKRLNNR